MTRYSDQKSLPYSCQELYQLVLDIESYPRFLPHCSSAKILKTSPDEIIAELSLGYGPFCETYTSKVTFEENKWIQAQAIHGLFKNLTTKWTFTEQEGNNTLVHFEITFEVEGFLLRKVAENVFSTMAENVMHAFESRLKKTA